MFSLFVTVAATYILSRQFLKPSQNPYKHWLFASLALKTKAQINHLTVDFPFSAHGYFSSMGGATMALVR